MKKRRFKGLKAVFIILAVMVLLTCLTSVLYTNVGTVDAVGQNAAAVTSLSSLPGSIVDNARTTASTLYGKSGERYNIFVDQLLTLYEEAKDKEVVVLFNPGGWGWGSVTRSPGWSTIAEGMQAELESIGNDTLFLNYRRTDTSLGGALDELVELLSTYPTKSNSLASRVQFLTGALPDIKVLIVGESNGTVMSDSAMTHLYDNPQVYGIHTGPPFWHKPVKGDRILIIDDNGNVPDSFSRGNIPAIAWASIKALFGIYPTENERGTIFYFLQAPGHDYRWQYPVVNAQISDFLEKNFGVNN